MISKLLLRWREARAERWMLRDASLSLEAQRRYEFMIKSATNVIAILEVLPSILNSYGDILNPKISSEISAVEIARKKYHLPDTWSPKSLHK